MTETELNQLRQITAAMIMDSYHGHFDEIHNAMTFITDELMYLLDKQPIEYHASEIKNAVIDAIALGLRLKNGLRV